MNTILIDTSHLLYRSWHTFKTFKNSNEEPTGLHFGIMRAIEHLCKEWPNAHLVFVFDGNCHQRRAIDPTYKGNRKDQPESHGDIIHEFGVRQDVSELIRACGCSIVTHSDYECDDLIAMLAKKPEFYGIPFDNILVYSGDDDFCQLVTDKVGVLKPPAGKTQPERVMNYAQVMKEWDVEPCSLPLFRSFTGDSGDNIPGIPRIPRARLTLAVKDKVSPDDFYNGDGVAYFPPDWVTKIQAYRERVYLNYRLTRLPFDYAPSLVFGFDGFGLNIGKLESLLRRLEFSSFLKKIGYLEELLGPVSYVKALSSISNRSESGSHNSQRLEESTTRS